MSFERNSSPGLSKRIAFFLGYAKNIYLRKREMMAIIKVEWENSVEWEVTVEFSRCDQMSEKKFFFRLNHEMYVDVL